MDDAIFPENGGIDEGVPMSRPLFEAKDVANGGIAPITELTPGET